MRGLLSTLIQISQLSCPHQRQWACRLSQDSRDRKFVRGGRMCWCMDCGKVLSYDPPAVAIGD